MEVVPSVLPFMEVVPKNVARVGAEQPQIGIPSQLFKRLWVRRQEAAPSEPPQKPLQSVTLLCGGKAPPCRQGIEQGGDDGLSGSSWKRRPCDRRVLKANCDDAHNDSVRSIWSLMFSCWFKVTPNTLKVSTCSATGIICFLEDKSTDFLRPRTIISLVLDELFQVVFGRPGLNVVKFFGSCVNHCWTNKQISIVSILIDKRFLWCFGWRSDATIT